MQMRYGSRPGRNLDNASQYRPDWKRQCQGERHGMPAASHCNQRGLCETEPGTALGFGDQGIGEAGILHLVPQSAGAIASGSGLDLTYALRRATSREELFQRIG
jgi:hypothetical protein